MKSLGQKSLPIDYIYTATGYKDYSVPLIFAWFILIPQFCFCKRLTVPPSPDKKRVGQKHVWSKTFHLTFFPGLGRVAVIMLPDKKLITITGYVLFLVL